MQHKQENENKAKGGMTEFYTDSTIFNIIGTLVGTTYNIGSNKQRIIGDCIEDMVIDVYKDSGLNFIYKSGERSMEDFCIMKDNVLHLIDVKTHNTNKDFCMPNLSSINRINDVYRDNTKALHYLFISYTVVNGHVTITKVENCRPHHISWNHLSIGNLGKGQLQIKNSHKLTFDVNMYSKDEWLSAF